MGAPVRWRLLAAVPCLLAGVLGVGMAGPVGADQGDSKLYRVAAASITAGSEHTCALAPSGAVRCWGYGGFGQLGHDAPTNIGDGVGSDASIETAPAVPVGGAAVAITAGDYHTCALRATGGVRCWGQNGFGQLGHDNTTRIGDGGSDPTIEQAGDVPLGGRAVAIAAGNFHTCALMATGAVRCWGDGSAGQLGLQSPTNVGDGVGSDLSIENAPQVPLGGTAVAIAAGGFHTCALMSNGKVRCWGHGALGELGHDSTSNIGDGVGSDPSIKTAGDVPLVGTAVAIAAGEFHTCALMSTGKVRCWGHGGFGELGHDNADNIGDGGTDPSIADAKAVPVGGQAVAVTAGNFHTCALLVDRAVRCWGDGASGQLGQDTVDNIGDGGSDPTIDAADDIDVGGTAVAITAGGFHTCALLTAGTVHCWGAGGSGQLGHDNRDTIGAGGTKITEAGDVPIGKPVRTWAAARLSATVGPSRDRRAPYAYRVTGHLGGRFVADRATCTGRVTLSVRHGHQRLQRRTTGLDAHCRYRFRTRLRATQLPADHTARLTFTLRYHGSRNLTPATTTRHARAR